MKLTTILLLFLITNSYSQEHISNGTIKVKKDSEREIVIDSVETIYMSYGIDKKYKYYIKASFPGGEKGLNYYLSQNINCPKNKYANGNSYVKFAVNTDSTISNIYMVVGIPNCPECDKETIRLIKTMPKWYPAIIDKKVAFSEVTLPVKFKSE